MNLISTFLLLFFVLYTVNGKPQRDSDDDIYSDTYDGVDVQNDNYDDDYDSEKSDYNEGEGKIISTAQTFNVKLGDDVYLPCNAEDAEVYVTMWKKNTTLLFQDMVPITKTNPPKYIRFDNRTLLLKDVTLQDQDAYSCELVPHPNNTAKIVHFVKVVKGPEIESITTRFNKTHIKAGEQLVLTCNTKNDQPEPKIIWSRNGHRLNEGKVLVIEKVTHSDTGYYQCLADNKIVTDHKIIHITVEYAPIVKIEKSIGIKTAEDYSTELMCTVRASPNATVVWKKNNEELMSTDHTRLSRLNENKHVLFIAKTTFNDFGVYTCVASNALGVKEAEYTLRGQPGIAKYIADKQTNLKNITLIWEIESESPITEQEIMYRKKGTNDWKRIVPQLAEQQGSLYKINHAISNLDNGDYEAKVRSKNKHGWSEFSEPVQFKGVHRQHHKKPTKKAYAETNNAQAPAKPETISAGESTKTTGSATAVTSSAALCVMIASLLLRFK